ncbi:MAG TPA: XdhC family protein [Actinomycetota bacterium]|nr:XdhC family protein [Actinomycetota bacterium]
MNGSLRWAAELESRNEPFALATVIQVERPVSAKPGDRAVVTSDGQLSGWVGGSCSEPIVVREALLALSDGQPRLVRIRPPEAPLERSQPGVIVEITTCESEGGLDVFVEPRLAKPHVVIVGSSPVARTLAELARTLGYRVSAALDAPSERIPAADDTIALGDLNSFALRVEDAVVIATMNRYDLEGTEAALATDAGYVGVVASKQRIDKLVELVRYRGIAPKALERLHGPAGFDLGPSTQQEIALAILAEMVAKRHDVEAARPEEFCEPAAAPAQAIDPICGMSVAIVEGAITASYDGETYYFCTPGCRKAFLADPAGTLERASAG